MTATPDTPATAAALKDLDRRYLLHPHQSGARGERCVIVRGKGSSVWDIEGTEFLDATGGGNWLAQVGHGRPELAAAAAAQLGELEYFTAFDIFTNDKAIELARRLVDLAPAGLDKVYFTCGGSEGVETAMKLARMYHNRRGAPERTWILARHMGYHGSTYGSGTATGWPMMQDGVGPNLPHIEKISPPNTYRADQLYGGQDPTDFLVQELEATIDRIGAGNIAAMIGEPVMGGGGVVAPPADYWPRVREVLRRNGILLIADEVVTAFGRTGSWFDSARRGMDADIVVTAKGLTSGYQPLGAVLLREDICETVAGEGAYFFHGHTYSGHSTACAVALANLELIANEGLVDASVRIGEQLRAGLAPLAELPHVGDVRVEGATVGIELVVDRGTTEPLMAGAVTNDLRVTHRIVARDYGPTLVLSPPLVFTQADSARTAAAVVDTLSRLAADGTVRSR